MRLRAIIRLLSSCLALPTNSYAVGEQDVFQPHMPEVKKLSDVETLFERARSETIEKASSSDAKGRFLVIVTPHREFLKIKCAGEIDEKNFLRDKVAESLMEPARTFVRSNLGSDRTLDISVIANTNPIAIARDRLDSQGIFFLSQAIPFFGYLLSMCELGHRTVVFEGHSSNFISAVKNTDVLLVDSGMIPFLRGDWMAAAFKAMRPSARVLVHERSNYSLHIFDNSGSADDVREIQLSDFTFSLPDGFRSSSPPGENASVVATKLGRHGALIFEADIVPSPGPMNERTVDYLLKLAAENSPQGPSAFSYQDRRLVQVGGVTGARAVFEWRLDSHGTRTLVYYLPSGEKLAIVRYTAVGADWEEALPIFEASAMGTKGLAPNTLSTEHYLGWRVGHFVRRYFWWLVGLVLLSLVLLVLRYR